MNPKVVPSAQLEGMVDRWKQAGKQVVLTAGRFDTLDEIQTELLRRARALGDALIVALYGEPSEPSDWQARADRLAALESVDSLTVLPEDAPVSLLQRLQPPYYVLLGEYGERDLPIVETVIAYGGFAVVLPRVSGESQG